MKLTGKALMKSLAKTAARRALMAAPPLEDWLNYWNGWCR